MRLKQILVYSRTGKHLQFGLEVADADKHAARGPRSFRTWDVHRCKFDIDSNSLCQSSRLRATVDRIHFGLMSQHLVVPKLGKPPVQILVEEF